MGAGTGHHIRVLLDKTPEAIEFIAGVSPAAHHHAAGRSPRLESVIADTRHHLPIVIESLEAVLCVLIPRNPAEFARVLSPGGRLVVVTPGRNRLIELRESLGLLGLDSEKLERLNGSMTGLDPMSRQKLAHPLNLSAEAAADPVAMGPDAFHTHKAPTAVRTTAAFVTSTFQQLQIHIPNRENKPAFGNL